MLPAQLDYAAPTRIADAVALAAQPGALIVAGGYQTVIDLKMRRLDARLLVDLRKIPELYGIAADGDGLRIGVMTTRRAIMDDAAIRAGCAALAEAAEVSGDPQLRNMATLGDDLTYSGDLSDVRAALLALEAVVHVAGANGERTIPIAEFATPKSLHQGEIVTAVSLPASAGSSAYEKFAHPATLAPICGVAVRLTTDANGVVQACAAAVAGAADHPVRLPGAESALQGQPLDEDTIAQAASVAGDGLAFVTDLFASGEYRAHLLQVLLKRALERLA